MKTNLIKSLCLALFFGILFSGCDEKYSDPESTVQPPEDTKKDNDPEDPVQPPKDEKGDIILTDIIFSFNYGDYSYEQNFISDQGRWDNSEWPWAGIGEEPNELNDPGRLFVIRSFDDLDKYSIKDRDVLPKIDFSKNILLLIDGATNYGISAINKSMLAIDSENYILKATLYHNGLCYCPTWKTAVLAPVLPAEAEIILELKKDYSSQP